MREFQAKKRIRKVLYSKGTIFALVILFMFMAHAAWDVFKKEQESATNVAQASRELVKLEDRKKILDAEIKRLSTSEGVEEEIRSKYSVSKPGEQLIIIVDTPTSTATTTKPEESWWDKLKHVFQ